MRRASLLWENGWNSKYGEKLSTGKREEGGDGGSEGCAGEGFMVHSGKVF